MNLRDEIQDYWRDCVERAMVQFGEASCRENVRAAVLVGVSGAASQDFLKGNFEMRSLIEEVYERCYIEGMKHRE